MASKPTPRVLFVDLANRPGSDRTLAGIARLGARCAVLAPARSFAGRSCHAAETFWLPTFGTRWIARLTLRRRLGEVVRAWRPDLLVPLDAPAARALDGLRHAANTPPALRDLINACLGSATALFGDRDHLSAMARDLGLPMASEGSAGTLVRMVACADGRVLEGASFLMTQVDPRSGDGTVLHPIARADMDAAARAIVTALGCSGLVSLRFALERDTVALASVDPGAPVGGHLGRLFGHDIHEALLDHFAGRPAPRPRPLADGPATIALFPNELDREPASRALNVPYGLHDLPWDDLGMMDIYAGWLRRRHRGSAKDLARHLPLDGVPSALDLRRLVASLDRYP